MKRNSRYSKEYDDEKARIVALYGVDITKALVNEYEDTKHSMKMREECYKSKNLGKTYSIETKHIDDDFIPAETVDMLNYEREL